LKHITKISIGQPCRSHMLPHHLHWLDMLLETHISMCDLWTHLWSRNWDYGSPAACKLLESLQPHWYASWASYM